MNTSDRDHNRAIDMQRLTERIAHEAGVAPMDVQISYRWDGDSTDDEEAKPWRVSISVRRKAARVNKHDTCAVNGRTTDDAARGAIGFRDHRRKKGEIE